MNIIISIENKQVILKNIKKLFCSDFFQFYFNNSC
jgi:hypothetical protein